MAGGRSSCYIILVNALLICLQGGKLNGHNSVLLNFVFAYVYSLSIDTQLIMQMLPSVQLHVISELNPKQISGEKQEMGNLQIFVEETATYCQIFVTAKNIFSATLEMQILAKVFESILGFMSY